MFKNIWNKTDVYPPRYEDPFVHTIFRKKEHNNWSPYVSSKWTTWEEGKTSKRYIYTDNMVKLYECKIDGKVQWISETDLQFPKQDI